MTELALILRPFEFIFTELQAECYPIFAVAWPYIFDLLRFISGSMEDSERGNILIDVQLLKYQSNTEFCKKLKTSLLTQRRYIMSMMLMTQHY